MAPVRRALFRRALTTSLAFVALDSLGCPRAATPPPLDPTSARTAAARARPRPEGPRGHQRYPQHEGVLATVFWVGQPPTAQDGCIGNLSSAFDRSWLDSYGGCDAATPRVEDGGCSRPASFVPRENPFYFALPYGGNAEAPYLDEVPWADVREAENVRSAIKNRWIGVRFGQRVCYAQWEDVGPACTDDVDYVFGEARPRNETKSCDGSTSTAGLDLSPALAICLGHEPDDELAVAWWFVDDEDVPEGPWRQVITRSPVRDGAAIPEGPCARLPPYPSCPTP